MAAADECAHGIDNHTNGIPDNTGDFFSVAAEDLEIDAGGVCWRDCIGDEAEGDDYGTEFAEAVEWAKTFDYEGALAFEVGGCVLGVDVYAGGETDAADDCHGEGTYKADEGEGKD